MPIIIRKKVASAPAPVLAPVVSPKVALSMPSTKREVTSLLDGQYHVARSAQNGAWAALNWLMCASYLYYHHDLSIISDELYDSLFADVDANRDKIGSPHLAFVTPDRVANGSMFDLKHDEYPSIVRVASRQLCKTSWGILIDIGPGL